jgi:hypothetical protein
MDDREAKLLQGFDRLLQEPSVVSRLDAIADSVEQKFQGSGELLAWEDVPLEIYKGGLPDEIRSSWVFLLRSGSNSGAERHPNSYQRVTAWRGRGDLQIWVQDRWESHVLVPDFTVAVQHRWASIPVNTWHQAVVEPGRHWVVVSFHTASTEELIEERPDPDQENVFLRRLYMAHS